MTINSTTLSTTQARTAKKRTSRSWGKMILYLFLLGVLLAITPFVWRGAMTSWADRYTYTPTSLPTEHSRVAIVYGARVYPSGRLSAMLRDRVETSIELYHAGEVDTLIMSGDGREANYDEPGFMAAYAIRSGVPAEAIIEDSLGLRTYDTCYNAEAMGASTAVLVTQEFHLPRAVVTCQALGLDVIGVIADRQSYSRRSLEYSTTREFFASQQALLDIIWQQPPTGTGRPALFSPDEG